MDRIKVKAAVAAAVKKYGYALVILLAGILLLMLRKKLILPRIQKAYRCSNRVY